MTSIYARLNIRFKHQYQTSFSARFDKQDENNQVLDDIEIYINLNINQNLTESDFVRFHIKSSLGNQVQKQESKYSGCRFDKIISRIFYFLKTNERICSSYVKVPLRSPAILIFENDDEYCFIWSVLAHLHPIADSRNGHPTRVSKFRQ